MSNKVKVIVFGKNDLVKRIIMQLCEKDEKSEQPFQYIGGYQPLDCELDIERESFSTQFLLLDYSKDYNTIPHHLIEIAHAVLFIVEQHEKFEQIERIKGYCQNIVNARKRELFISFVGIIQEANDSEALDSLISSLNQISESICTDDLINVNFSVSSDIAHVFRQIKDLVNISSILTVI